MEKSVGEIVQIPEHTYSSFSVLIMDEKHTSSCHEFLKIMICKGIAR